MAFEQILDDLGPPGREPPPAAAGDVMLTLGEIAFSVSTAAYQTFQRSTQFRWPAHERFGVRPAYQWTGPGEDAITLTGAIFPTYRGRPSMLDDLRSLAAQGEARLMTAGTGEAFGRWILAAVDEERSGLFAAGEARKIAYTLKLRRAEAAPSGRQDRLESSAAAVGNVNAAIEAFT